MMLRLRGEMCHVWCCSKRCFFDTFYSSRIDFVFCWINKYCVSVLQKHKLSFFVFCVEYWILNVFGKHVKTQSQVVFEYFVLCVRCWILNILSRRPGKHNSEYEIRGFVKGVFCVCVWILNINCSRQRGNVCSHKGLQGFLPNCWGRRGAVFFLARVNMVVFGKGL